MPESKENFPKKSGSEQAESERIWQESGVWVCLNMDGEIWVSRVDGGEAVSAKGESGGGILISAFSKKHPAPKSGCT